MPQISPRKNRSNETDSRTMYLNLIQIAESFGVSETPNDSAIWIRFKYMVRESVSFDRFLRGDICGMRRLWRSHELWRYLNKPDIFVGLEPYLYRISIFFSRQPGSADLLLWRMAIATPPTNHEPVPIGHPAPPP